MSFKSHRPTDKTRQQAQSASGLGLPQDQIAALIGIGCGGENPVQQGHGGPGHHGDDLVDEGADAMG